MNRLALVSVGAVLVALAGCQQDTSDTLSAPGESAAMPWSPNSLAAGKNTWNHKSQSLGSGVNGITDPDIKVEEDQAIGTPDVVARLHGVQKMQVAALNVILSDLGVNMGSTATNSAGQLFAQGQSALGVAVYASRVPEMIIPSTAALAKEYDIFVAAAPEILKSNLATSKRCPGTELVDTSGDFTQDGVSCLLGKPATTDYMTLVKQIIAAASDPATGQQIAVATLLAAAHTSE